MCVWCASDGAWQAGVGSLTIEETRHLPLELARGQVLEYDAVPGPVTDPPTNGARPTAKGEGNAGSARNPQLATAEATPSDERPSRDATLLAKLSVALVGSVYVLPHLRAVKHEAWHDERAQGDDTQKLRPLPRATRYDCGGTYEPATPAMQRRPADAAYATTQLHAPLLALFPPLCVAGTPRRARAGVRALPPRCELGAVPLAGRAHACFCAESVARGGSAHNVWVLSGVGSRGLLYHALLAAWLVDAAASDDAARLPDEVRRGEFGLIVSNRLAKVAERRRAEEVQAKEVESEAVAVS